MSKIEKLREFLKPQDEKWVYEPGDEITQEELELIRNANTQQKKTLFKKSEVKYPYDEYNVSYICSECGKMITEKMTKTQIMDKNRLFVCDKCVQKKEEDRKKRRAEEERIKKEKEEETRYFNTEMYMISYLDCDMTWKKGTPQWKKWKEINIHNIDKELIAQRIKYMNYKDFLKTPYWDAVSNQVKKNNVYTCQLCGAKNVTLHVHHPNYDFHGYEADNIDKLLCLCEKCHQKHHNIEETKCKDNFSKIANGIAKNSRYNK